MVLAWLWKIIGDIQMRSGFTCFFLLLLGSTTVPPGVAHALEESSRELQGRLVTAALDTDSPPDFREAIIFLRPDEPAAVDDLSAVVEMRMEGKAFKPGVLAVTVGTTVSFPNVDPIIHNAFSTSTSSAFDLGFYGAGEQRSVTFEQAGLVRVYCNVHHAMAGYIMALDTPYFTQPDAAGRFALTVPAGTSGTLYIWHPQARVERLDIVAESENAVANQPLQVSMTFNGRRVPRHLNKHGKPYRKLTRPGY
jgi:plastocyanin